MSQRAGRCRNGAEDGDGVREEAALTRCFHKGPSSATSVAQSPGPPCPQLPRGSLPGQGCSGPPRPQPPLPEASAEHFLTPLYPYDRCSSHSAFSGGNKSLSKHTKARRRREAWA